MQNEEKRITRAERNRKKSIFKLNNVIKPYEIKKQENKNLTRVERLKELQYKREIIKLRTVLSITVILIIYFLIAVYFKNHFYFG